MAFKPSMQIENSPKFLPLKHPLVDNMIAQISLKEEFPPVFWAPHTLSSRILPAGSLRTPRPAPPYSGEAGKKLKSHEHSTSRLDQGFRSLLCKSTTLKSIKVLLYPYDIFTSNYFNWGSLLGKRRAVKIF
jgi:hypothetical protein